MRFSRRSFPDQNIGKESTRGSPCATIPPEVIGLRDRGRKSGKDQLAPEWECRCTLMNSVTFSRCAACGTPKSRQSQQQQQQTANSRRRGSSPAPGGSSCGPAAPTGARLASRRSSREPCTPSTGVSAAQVAGESKKPCRQAVLPPQKSKTLNKRTRTSSPHGRNGGESRSPAGASNERPRRTFSYHGAGASDTVVSSVRVASSSSLSSSSTKGKSSRSFPARSKKAVAAAAVPVVGVNPPQLKSARSSSVTSATSTSTEGSAASEFQQQQQLEQAMQHHSAKRVAVGAALARSAFARLSHTAWEDVGVDWCPREQLVKAEQRVCDLLGVSTLGLSLVRAGGIAKAKNGRGRASGAESAAAAAAAASGMERAGSSSDKEELRMSVLFPLPPPQPAQYVKRGIYASENGVATVPLAPPTLQPNGTIPEGEVVAPVPVRCTSGRVDVISHAMPITKASNDGGDIWNGELDISGKSKASAFAEVVVVDDDLSAGAAAATATVATGAAAATAIGAETDSDSTSTTTTVDSNNLAQYAMTAAERSRAYKGIFRNGGEKPKKRPRSPVVCTRLRLPFPMAPRGGVDLVTTAALDERPPCGSERHVQTEFGSEWAWGVLGGPEGSTIDRAVGSGGGNWSVGCSGGKGGNGWVGGGGGSGSGSAAPVHRDFRLPYEVVYSFYREEFDAEVRQLGMRSAADAMGEFKSTASNVYLSKKVSDHWWMD